MISFALFILSIAHAQLATDVESCLPYSPSSKGYIQNARFCLPSAVLTAPTHGYCCEMTDTRENCNTKCTLWNNQTTRDSFGSINGWQGYTRTFNPWVKSRFTDFCAVQQSHEASFEVTTIQISKQSAESSYSCEYRISAPLLTYQTSSVIQVWL